MNTEIKYYAGVGSRETPSDILRDMQRIAVAFNGLGWRLRSGGARGADRAFAKGATPNWDYWGPTTNNPSCNWIPYNILFAPEEWHFKAASYLHPVWKHLPSYVQELHARNIGQILGRDFLYDPEFDSELLLSCIRDRAPITHFHPTFSRFTVCWTKDGARTARDCTAKTGGTGTAIKLSSIMGIEVTNMQNLTINEHLLFMGLIDAFDKKPKQSGKKWTVAEAKTLFETIASVENTNAGKEIITVK